MSSPLDIGLGTGQSTGGGCLPQSSLEGLLTLDPTKLAEAIKANPAGVQKMLEQWSQKLEGVVNAVSGPAARSNRESAAMKPRSPSWAARSPR